MDYCKLRAKIFEVFRTQEAFALAMRMSLASLNQRLSGKLDWKACEIARACELLDIPIADNYLYFFTR